MKTTRPSGIFGIALVAGLVSAVASALAFVATVAIGAGYNPAYFARFGLWLLATALVLCLAIALLIRRARAAPFAAWPAVAAVLTGLCCAGFGLVSMAGDPGDLVLYAGPAILGLSLIALAFEPEADNKEVA